MIAKLSFALGAIALTASSFAGVLTDAVSTTGSQAWTGSLGMDFNVGPDALLVTNLGAFDHKLDGFDADTTITVGIYDRATEALVGSTATFTQAAAGALNGAWREKEVTPFVLAPNGQYAIVAFGFNAIDLNYNTEGASDAATNSAPGLLTFVGSSRYSGGTGYPTTLDGATIRYGAGNFTAQAVPEPTTLAGLAALAVPFARRRARR